MPKGIPNKPRVTGKDIVEVPAAEKNEVLSGPELTPSNWDISPHDGDVYLFKNNNTGRELVMTVSEFNSLINPRKG